MCRRLWVALAALALALAVSAAPAVARGGPQRLVVKPGGSIQRAVDAARPGATIFVKRGVYRENVAIAKDGIRLRGLGAELRPPATPAPTACSFGEPAEDGICVVGQLQPPAGEDEPPTVERYVRDVTVSGFTVRGFAGTGVIAFGASGATFAGNHAVDDGEYGLAAFFSTGTRMLRNRAHGSGEAGLYVGDSPQARATLLGNLVYDNGFGIFVRDAEHGRMVANRVTGNCIGVLFLADAPGPAGKFRVHHNLIARNSRACPASQEEGEEGPALSGIGIAVGGANGLVVRHNAILRNTPGGETAFKGGVVIVRGDAGTAPADNRVRRNLILGNDPDLFWDGSGTGNVLQPNVCRTSQPAGLCG